MKIFVWSLKFDVELYVWTPLSGMFRAGLIHLTINNDSNTLYCKCSSLQCNYYPTINSYICE